MRRPDCHNKRGVCLCQGLSIECLNEDAIYKTQCLQKIVYAVSIVCSEVVQPASCGSILCVASELSGSPSPNVVRPTALARATVGTKLDLLGLVKEEGRSMRSRR